ncbi:amidohydrolase family protein [Subtercola boreus]|uniref:amidohydrolase family protein n=1 Tax=Subtercola boreus TaxID=120213 RepID=UPI001559A75E|nr:amidohydrolase family protein [Subtercola boreus]
MRVIDTHAHLWRRSRTPQPWIDPASMAVIDRDFWFEDLALMQRQSGIDGAVLVQSVNDTQESVDLLSLVDGRAVLGVIGWIDLEQDVAAQLAALREQPGGHRLLGIRHLAHLDLDPEWLLRPTVDLAALGDAGLPFDLVVRADQLGIAEHAVAAHPRTRFVLDHLGNPPLTSGDLAGWRHDLGSLARHENVVVKLSGLTLQTDWSNWSVDDLREPVDVALDHFGPSRVMFGSDWPLVTLASDAPSWVDIVRELVPTALHDNVFGGTAERVYLEEHHA